MKDDKNIETIIQPVIIKEMANNKESFWDGLIKFGTILTGAWLSIELLKFFTKEVYRCPNCNQRFEQKYSERCPHCNQQLRWRI